MPRIYGFDSETHLITPDNLAPKCVCYTCYVDGEAHIMLPQAGAQHLGQALLDADTIVTAHNLAFDFGVMIRVAPWLFPLFIQAAEDGRLADTKLRERLLRIAVGEEDYHAAGDKLVKTGYSLADLVKRYFAVDISAGKKAPDAWRLRYSELDGVPLDDWPNEAIDYAISDAVFAADVYEAQADYRPPDALTCLDGWELFQPNGRFVNEEEQTRAALALHMISLNGVKAHGPYVQHVTRRLKKEVNAKKGALLKAGLLKPNPKRPAGYSKDMGAIREAVDEAYMGTAEVTPSGATSTASKTLMASGDPDLVALADLCGTEKILSAFVPVLEQAASTGISPGYSVIKTTGRTSSSRPNIQQLPRKGGVRECFVPSPGYVFCAIDYDALELSCVAQAQHDLGTPKNPPLMKAINEGKDPHIIAAASLMGVDYDDAMHMYKQGTSEQRAHVREARQFAKILNFGGWGGLGPDALVSFGEGYGMEISNAAASTGLATWKKTWCADQYFAHASRITSKYKVKWGDKSPEGRAKEAQNFVKHLRSGRIRGAVSFTQACNSYFQGMAADGAKLALWNLLRACYSPGHNAILFGGTMATFIHDEVIFEFPETRAAEMGHEAARIMRDSMRVYVPDVHIGAEPALMKRWYKDAEPFYVDGVLSPWEKIGVDCTSVLALYHEEASDALASYAKVVGPAGEGVEEYMSRYMPWAEFEPRPLDEVEFYCDYYIGA